MSALSSFTQALQIAATELAAVVDLTQRIETDAGFVADRSDAARLYRDALFDEKLRAYRTAREALLDAERRLRD